MKGLAEQYLSARADAARAEPVDLAALEAALARALEAGRRTWPAVEIDAGLFVLHLAGRTILPTDPALRAADLWLACACTHGVPAALAAFDELYLARVPEFLARVMGAPDLADEVTQQLRQRLLVGAADAPARIADYQGRGSLENWLRAAAARTALNLERGESRRRRAARHAAAEAGLHADDPELEHVKRRHGPQLEAAVRAAFAALSGRERTLLRMHYIEQITVNRIATSYGVHRATVSRWLLGAQQQLFEETRRLLREHLRLSTSECDSLVGVLRSRLDVTLGATCG